MKNSTAYNTNGAANGDINQTVMQQHFCAHVCAGDFGHDDGERRNKNHRGTVVFYDQR